MLRTTHAITAFATLMLAIALGGAGCGSNTKSQPGPAADPKPAPSAATAAATALPPAAEADQIFAMRCTPCHGPQGRGDGPASAGLTPKPRNFSDATWQGSVTDEHIERIIQYGGAAVGKSPAMPPNPDLTSKPEVVAALRAHVRGLKQSN
jgi:hypothetical protein